MLFRSVYHPYGYEYYIEVTRKESEKKELANSDAKKAQMQSKAPTLDDVFVKKTYYNPGKIEARRKQQVNKYEKQLEESEIRLADLQMQLMNPVIASDYEKLTKIGEDITKEEELQDNLLTWLTELEIEGTS